ncbi:uncharacterized protein TrAtP1_009739 [Trichoderma atroviride]|uniref:uncharacterized protein n=1 Tax=Hypocrea atroviridis TaxID=63577 RepID=UPI00331F64D5|nr:hypothetical protein TrAtP1_009739 [Trichoderma atroviride]
MWLRDFLPLDALQARVLVYYHNSGWQAHALGMSLRDYGQDLLTSIEGVRQTETERHRPVVLIGYSFGGLIIKQAMLMAHGDTSGKSQSAFSPDCAKGFIFLETPHLGSELTIFAKALSLLGYWQGASTALLEVIDPRSPENKSLHEIFLTRFANRDMVNFYEVQPESVGPFPIMNAVKKRLRDDTPEG